MKFPFVPSNEASDDFLVGPPGLTLPLSRSDPLESGLALYSGRLGRLIASGETGIFGIARLDDSLLMGANIVAGRRENVIGNCSLVHNGRTTIISADFTGLAPLFYCDAAGLLVSNRLHLILIAMRQRGVQPSPDAGAIAVALARANGIGQQLATFQTCVAGVKMLHADMRVEASSVGWTLVAASPDHDPLAPDDYRALIRKGAEEITSNIQACLDSGYPIQSSLTAGRDSRTLLAAIVAMGKLRDIPIYTMDTVPEDREMSSALVSFFGGHYVDTFTEVIEADPNDIVQRYRSILLGCYHAMAARTYNYSTVYFGQERAPPIRLRGGCSEIYRIMYAGFNPRRVTWRRWQDPRKMLTETEFFRSVAAEDAGLGLEALASTFDQLHGPEAWRRIIEHYRQFRNKFHFGLMSFYQTGLSWHPLASPSLLRASRGLPFEVMKKGRVNFDVTRELCDIAAYLPCNGSRMDLADEYHVAHRYDGVEFSLKPDADLYAKTAAFQCRGMTPEQAAGYHQAQERHLAESVEALSAHPVIGGMLTASNVRGRLTDDTERRWYSKVSALADAFCVAS
ncbi:hypothetical protein [Reyranella sp.]|uniref:hypothetical protein n=1 Tax=Reyranella sp. TaxID=1929291 RepID=UPI003D0B0899